MQLPIWMIGASLSWASLIVGTRLFLLAWMWAARHVSRYLSDPDAGQLFRRKGRRAMVRGNPVAWRELSTRGSAGMGLLVRGATLVWSFIALISLTFMGGFDESSVHVMLSMSAFFLVFSGAMLTATSTVIDERHSRTLPILLLTPMRRSRIVLGKLMAVWWRALPLMTLAILLIVWVDMDFYTVHDNEWHVHKFGPNLMEGYNLPRLAILSTWLFAILSTHVLSIVLVALLVRPARLAWPAIPAVAALWWTWPVIVMFLIFEFGGLDISASNLEWAGIVWFPFADNDAMTCDRGGAPMAFVIGTAAQLVFGVVLGWLIKLRLNALMRM